MKSVLPLLARVGFGVTMMISIFAFGEVVGLRSPWFGLVASFCVLGLMDLTMPLVSLRMPSSLRPLRPWELREGAYRNLGVPAFGVFLRRTPVRLLNRRVYLGAHSGDLEPVRRHVERAEAAHFWGGLATVPYLALAGIRGWWGALLAVALFDLVVNIYPILHLRTVRGRLARAVATGARRIRRNAP